MTVNKSNGYPLIYLLLCQDKAIRDKRWIEAIVLARMFFDAQLRLLLGVRPVRKKRNPPPWEDKFPALIKRALANKLIDHELNKRLIEFNTMSVDAVHQLAMGLMEYEELEPMARQSATLVVEIQRLYAGIEAGPGG